MKYEDTGVVYELMDPYKRAAQIAARATAGNLTGRGFVELEWTRGESVYVVKQRVTFNTQNDLCIGFVVEGLGTKNIVLDRMRLQAEIRAKAHAALGMDEIDAFRYSANIAIDNAAMVFNDMATLGIRPVVFGQHLAVGASEWFQNQERWNGLIHGTVVACNVVGCTWGCGETPTLKGIVEKDAAELSGSSWGMCTLNQLICCNIAHGDRIILIPSSGVHANGLTMCRSIADSLPKGYYTSMNDGRPFGDGLLQPTALYGPMVEACQNAGAEIHYAVNITGHGWRKLMRAIEPFVYIIDKVPDPQPVFRFIQKHGKASKRDMYADFNMGAGFALFVHPESVPIVEEIGRVKKMPVLDAGYIEKRGGEKRVEIRPIKEVFEGKELEVR